MAKKPSKTSLEVLNAKLSLVLTAFLTIIGLIVGSGYLNSQSIAKLADKVTEGIEKTAELSERVARVETKVEPNIKIQYVYTTPPPPIVFEPPPMLSSTDKLPTI